MTARTRKGCRFKWSNECEVSFHALKTCLTQAPLLSYPTREGEYILDTDASDCGLGTTLSQIQDGQERVITYASSTLSKNQQAYCPTYKELLAVRLLIILGHISIIVIDSLCALIMHL